MNNPNDITKEGDLVLLYASPESIQPLYLKSNEIHQCWLYILKPNPELYTLSLTHRTQIIYNMDASYICLGLYLQNGSFIIESGTGSGSLTSHFSKCVGNNGHVYTFEFNELRYQLAKEEFQKNKLDNITIYHGDIINDGFDDNLINKIDAVFLDIPKPWEAIKNTINLLKSGGRICTFSPCIEQVSNNCKTMNELGFIDIETVEVLVRPYEVIPSFNNNNNELSSYWDNNTYCCRLEKEIKSHTSYLSFATIYKL